MIGCASALELRSAGFAVTLIERGRIGSEATWAGAGLLSALLPWDYRPEVLDLLEWSRDLYPAWLASLASDIDAEYQKSGLLVLLPYNEASAQTWARQYARCLMQVIAKDIEPGTADAEAALWLPDIAQVRNPRLIRALRNALIKRGVVVHEETAFLDWEMQNGRVTAALTSQGPFPADKFVLTAGAWSSRLLPDPFHFTLKPMRGQIIAYKETPGRLRTMVYRNGFYLIPRLDGHILVGSTLEDVGFDKSVTENARQMLMQQAVAILPWLKGSQPVAHWAGLRPGSSDNIPLIGQHPKIENLYINTGHFRYGVTMAPASARLLTDLILNRASALDLKPYAWSNVR